MSKTGRTHRTTGEYVIIRLGEKNFLCDLMCIQEIVYAPDLEPCLDGPQFLVGLYKSSRGPLPVLDIMQRMPDECPLSSMTLLIFETDFGIAGLLVDDLLSTTLIDSDWLQPLIPGMNGDLPQGVEGTVEIEGIVHFLLDLQTVLSTCLGAATGRTPEGDGDS